MAVPAWYKVYRNSRSFASVTRAVTNTTNLGTEVHNIQGCDHISAFWVQVTAVSGTAESTVVTIQHSPDGGVTWLDGDASAALTLAGGVQTVKIVATIDYFHLIRVKDVVANTTTPSITYVVWYGFDKASGGLSPTYGT